LQITLFCVGRGGGRRGAAVAPNGGSARVLPDYPHHSAWSPFGVTGAARLVLRSCWARCLSMLRANSPAGRQDLGGPARAVRGIMRVIVVKLITMLGCCRCGWGAGRRAAGGWCGRVRPRGRAGLAGWAGSMLVWN